MDPIVTLFVNTLLGGFSVTTTLTGMEGEELFPTIQGSGDAKLQCYFGPLDDAITGNPLPGLPPGFFPGVLDDEYNGFTSLSSGAQFNFGSSTPGGGVASFPTSYGLTQTPDGWTRGKWVFVATVLSVDIFSTDFGLGWGRAYAGGAGMNPSYWSFNGQFSSTDPNGGALIITGGPPNYAPTFGAQGNILAQPAGVHMGELTTFGAAIWMDPPIQLSPYDPQKLIPVSMPCVPCCPTPCNGRFV